MSSPVDRILHAFSPQVVIFSDADVDRACEVNGCKGLDQLFLPWQSKIERVPILSSQLTLTTHPTWAIRFVSHAALMQSHRGGGGAVPYSPEIVVDIVSHLIANTKPEQNLQYDILRDVLLASSPLDGRDSFNYPVCHIFATSSSSVDPLAALDNLVREAQISPVLPTMPKNTGMKRDVQRFYLLVHDVAREGQDLARSRQTIRRISEKYGPHCDLLAINSKLPLLANSANPSVFDEPHTLNACNSASDEYMKSLNDLICVNPFSRLHDVLDDNVQVQRLGSRLITRPTTISSVTLPYARYLADQDIEGIRECIRGITVQSIIPWMESKVREWNELYSQSKKGVAAKLFGAGRKLFGSANTGTDTPNENSSRLGIQDTEENISRLADFAFMLKDYRQATSIYEAILDLHATARETFYSNHANIMRAVSTLLSSRINRNMAGTRAGRSPGTLLSNQGLQQSGCLRRQDASTGLQHLSALFLLIEIAGDEQVLEELGGALTLRTVIIDAADRAEDICGAILLQKAATVSSDSIRRFPRKRALDLMLASQKYARCGFRAFSEANLLQALGDTNCSSPPWRYIKDHLTYTLAQIEYTSGQAELAEKRFLSMLAHTVGSLYREGILQDATLAHERYQKQQKPSDVPYLLADPLSAPLSINLQSSHSRGCHVSSILTPPDHASTLRHVVTFINRTTTPLRLSDIDLWPDVESEGSKVLCPSGQERSLVILPGGKRQTCFHRIDHAQRNFENYRVTYTLQDTFKFSQQIRPCYDSDITDTIHADRIASTGKGIRSITGNPSTFPLRITFLGIPKSIRNHETLGFTLSLLNNSESEITAISLRSSDSTWQLSWSSGDMKKVSGEAEESEASCNTPTSNAPSSSELSREEDTSSRERNGSANLVKVLRPGEFVLLAGTVTVHASHMAAMFDLAAEYTFRGTKCLQHEKSICSLAERPWDSSETTEMTVQQDKGKFGIICVIKLERGNMITNTVLGDQSVITHLPSDSYLQNDSVPIATHKAQLYRRTSPTQTRDGHRDHTPLLTASRRLSTDGRKMRVPIRISNNPSYNPAPIGPPGSPSQLHTRR